MMNAYKKFLSLGAALLALGSVAKAHTIALGWDVLANSDVTFYLAHWHGNLAGPSQFLTIDGNQYAFTSVQNDVNSRTDLEGALWNTTYFTGTSSSLTATTSSNDWLIVTVSGLTSGSHVFQASTAALTFWTLPSSNGSFEFNLPPPVSAPDGSTTVALIGLALVGVATTRRKLGRA